MKIKFTAAFLLALFPYVFLSGQERSDYYYYKGEKIPLEKSLRSFTVLLRNTNLRSTLSFDSPYQIKRVNPNQTPASIIRLNPTHRTIQNTYTGRMELTGTTDLYTSAIQSIRLQPGVIKVSPTYIINDKETGVSHEFYVKLFTPDDVSLLDELARQYSIEIVGYNRFMPLWFVLACTENTPYHAVEAANLFYETGLFECAEPGFLEYGLTQSNDPLFSLQWGLNHTGQSGWSPQVDIKAEQAWTITTGSTDIKTAVLDDGIKTSHPDLQGNIYGTGYDATYGTSPAKLRGDHGTLCAGIIGAVQNNMQGISGVAPASKLIPISTEISGKYDSTTVPVPLQLADGINWAWQNGADIISNSWITSRESDLLENAITNALTYGRSGKGCIVVFSSGNYDSKVRYPANANPLILTVGAISPCGQRKNQESCDNVYSWSGSCYGNELDIMAPGVKIPTTNTGGTWNDYGDGDYIENFGGTSAACPHVAGVAALILSVNPDLTVRQVNDIIESTAQKIRTDLYAYQHTSGRDNGTWNEEMGYGLVDAYQAVKLAQDYECLSNVNITQPVTGSWIYRAANTITASSQIAENTTVSLQAATVRLLPGFSSSPGTTGKLSVIPTSCTAGLSLHSVEKENTDFDYYRFYTDKIASYIPMNIHTPFDDNVISISQIQGWVRIRLAQATNGYAEIFTLQGNRIARKQFDETKETGIELTGQPSGVYLVRVTLSDRVISKKIML